MRVDSNRHPYLSLADGMHLHPLGIIGKVEQAILDVAPYLDLICFLRTHTKVPDDNGKFGLLSSRVCDGEEERIEVIAGGPSDQEEIIRLFRESSLLRDEGSLFSDIR